jgi:histidine triad (HIT) family protein
MIDCLFCKIANKELPCEVVFEDEQVLVFKDIYPRAPLHYLIIPKNHIESIASDNSEEIVKDLIKVAKKIATEQEIAGYKLVFNVGEKQNVPHIHLHFLCGDNSE